MKPLKLSEPASCFFIILIPVPCGTESLHDKLNHGECLSHRGWNGRTELRLTSRKPFWTKVEELGYTNYSPTDEWSDNWRSESVTNYDLVEDPNEKVAGFDLNRKSWCQLNRIRTNHGRCNATLHKWNPSIEPGCDCGHEKQTISHIVNDCENRYSLTHNLAGIATITEHSRTSGATSSASSSPMGAINSTTNFDVVATQ